MNKNCACCQKKVHRFKCEFVEFLSGGVAAVCSITCREIIEKEQERCETEVDQYCLEAA